LNKAGRKLSAPSPIEKARNLAYDKAEQFYEGVLKRRTWLKMRKDIQAAVMETGSFSRPGAGCTGQDKGPSPLPHLRSETDEISDIQDIGDRYYLIQPTETIDAAIPGLEAVNARK
jgi:peptidyl-prolyl cis-trans isomerase D